MAEAMLGEPSDVSRVVFVPDSNTAAVVTQGVYKTQGQFWTLVVPKADTIPDLFTADEATRLLEQGALHLEWAGYDGASRRFILTAIGAYQLEEVLKASARLAERQLPHRVVYMLEPGRFRRPGSAGEQRHAAPSELVVSLYPEATPARLFVSHTRPEVVLGVLQPLHTGYSTTSALGFIGQGGTLTVAGMLFVNRSTWAHALDEAARLLSMSRQDLLTAQELAALDGQASPHGVII